jgi:DNA-binding SARP family transcriptional activator
MGIRVYVTGRVAVEVDGQVVINERRFRGKQDRLLFVYLVCERSRPVAKEELASVLWPDEQSDAWEGRNQRIDHPPSWDAFFRRA